MARNWPSEKMAKASCRRALCVTKANLPLAMWCGFAIWTERNSLAALQISAVKNFVSKKWHARLTVPCLNKQLSKIFRDKILIQLKKLMVMLNWRNNFNFRRKKFRQRLAKVQLS